MVLLIVSFAAMSILLTQCVSLPLRRMVTFMESLQEYQHTYHNNNNNNNNNKYVMHATIDDSGSSDDALRLPTLVANVSHVNANNGVNTMHRSDSPTINPDEEKQLRMRHTLLLL